MRIIPAIDISSGECVRLFQGNYDRSTTYNSDPVAQAQKFVAEGAELLHIVDLDAARKQSSEIDPEAALSQNRQAISDVCSQVDVNVQVGGGVRSVAAAQQLIGLGVDRVVVGTAAVEAPELVDEMRAEGIQVVVGLDVRGEVVATHGWEVSSGLKLGEAIKRFENLDLSGFVITQIEVDGTMEGPATELYGSILERTSIPVIASGGVGCLKDFDALLSVSQDRGSENQKSLEGVIVGKALYEKKFELSEAINYVSAAEERL